MRGTMISRASVSLSSKMEWIMLTFFLLDQAALLSGIHQAPQLVLDQGFIAFQRILRPSRQGQDRE